MVKPLATSSSHILTLYNLCPVHSLLYICLSFNMPHLSRFLCPCSFADGFFFLQCPPCPVQQVLPIQQLLSYLVDANSSLKTQLIYTIFSEIFLHTKPLQNHSRVITCFPCPLYTPHHTTCLHQQTVSFQNAADYLFIASIMYLADIQCYLSDKFQILTNVMV